MRTSAAPIPAKINFPEQAAREEGWGWLATLSAGSATLVTAVALAERERIFLSFEISGEVFQGLPCEVGHVERDADGYFVAELALKDEVERRRLARLLIDVLAR